MDEVKWQGQGQGRRLDDIQGFTWCKSKAKKLIVQGLENGHITDLMTPAVVFDKYDSKHHEHFKFVGFRLFPERLKRLRAKYTERENFCERDAAALAHDRRLYPSTEYTEKGIPIWRKTSTIRQLLSQDIVDNKHKEMSPEELWESREEYKKNDLKTFRNHIYSTVKSAKFKKYCEDQHWKKQVTG
jgi:hypothetical protein